MTAPKPGDRVRVEYEAEYESKQPDGHLVKVDGIRVALLDGVTTLTVLPKPLRVGDKVRVGEDPEPPVGAVLLVDEDGSVLQRLADGTWSYASTTGFAFGWDEFRCSDRTTVIWLPEVAS